MMTNMRRPLRKRSAIRRASHGGPVPTPELNLRLDSSLPRIMDVHVALGRWRLGGLKSDMGFDILLVIGRRSCPRQFNWPRATRWRSSLIMVKKAGRMNRMLKGSLPYSSLHRYVNGPSILQSLSGIQPNECHSVFINFNFNSMLCR